MNNVILDLVPKSSGAAVDGAASSAGTKAGGLGAQLFRTTLAARLRTAATSAKTGKTTLVPADTATLRALQTKISKLLESGASQTDVVNALAAQLASSVAQTLETPATDARTKLQTLFATALGPPGRGDPATAPVAERALALAQRFIRLANLAGAIAGQPSGQQKRIAGNVLDAQRAKDIPAPTPTSDSAPAAGTSVQPALVAAPPIPVSAVSLPAPANSTRPAGVSPAVTAAPAELVPPALAAPAHPQPFTAGPANGDGRRVNIGSRAAVASGGDTGLGRILSRAVLAADARASTAPRIDAAATAAKPTAGVPASTAPANAVAANSAPEVKVPHEATATPLRPVPRAVPDAGADTGTTSGATGKTAPSRVALAAFVRSFEAALSAGESTAGTQSAGESKPPAPAAVHAATDAQAVAAAPAVSTAVERIAPATASAAPAATAPVDHSAIADQVLRGAFLRNTGASSEIRLSLVPETLGDVSVKLVVTAGSVAAHVVAETPEVRDALVAAQPQLTKSLADAGLKLTSFNVDLAGSGFAGFSHQQNAQSQNEQRARRSILPLGGDDASDDAGLAAIPSFGPPAVPKPSAGDYNYLA